MENVLNNDQYEQLKGLAYAGNYGPLLSAVDIDSSILNRHDVWGYTVLHWLARYGKKDIIGELLNRGADVNILHAKRWNALMFAAEQNKIDTAIYLISRGADLEAANEGGKTALTLYGCRADEPMNIDEKDACRNILQTAYDKGPLALKRKKDAKWARRKYFMLTLAGCNFHQVSTKQLMVDIETPANPIILDTPEKKHQYLLMMVFSNEGLIRDWITPNL